jgi:hypothetical protein
MTLTVLRAWDRPTLIFCPPIIAPRTETGKSSAPPRRYHTIEIQFGLHTITAADPCRATYITPWNDRSGR